MRRIAALALAGVVLLGIFAGGTTAHPGMNAAPDAPSDNQSVSVMTTATFSFVPNEITVTPGAHVHLVVTQAANVGHTFVLSSVVNFTIPSGDSPDQLYAFFNAHPPLVNLTIPATVGTQVSTNFTAPSEGTYEFVCIVPGHFQNGMFGFLDSTTTPASSSSSSGLPLTDIVLGAVAAAVLVAVVVVLLVRRHPRAPAPPAPGSG
jgi:uncharacterized cupredoxin-like copper-binding protein